MAAWRRTASASRRTAVMSLTSPVLKRSERRAIARQERKAQSTQKTAVTASAAILRADRGSVVPKKQWQSEAWDQYRAQGEAWFAVEWKANAVSRVRLKAARIVDGGDEPEIINDGPVAELVERLAGGIGGQSSLLKSASVKLDVPGDAYFVGYEDSEGIEHWNVYSADVVRKEMSGGFAIRVDESTWLPLPVESLVIRVWNPDEQFPWLAISPMMPALSVLREIDLYNRKLITQLTARLASNGILFIPDEIAFPVRDEFSDAADPFVSELIDVASKAIQNPGSAAAALPIPLRVPMEMIEKFRHMTFADDIVQETLDGRDKAIIRLGNMLNVPSEVLTGMGATNHWCVDSETEALTLDGWKREHEISIGDVVLTLNHETGVSEWQPVRDIYRAHVVDESMVSMERSNHSSLTTANHRWAITRERNKGKQAYISREFVHSMDLDRPHRIPTAAPHADLPTEAKYSDDFVELVGWYWTEGSQRGLMSSVSQSHTRNPERVARIRSVLNRLYGSPVETVRGLDYPAWRETIQSNDSSYGGPVTIFHLNREITGSLVAVVPSMTVTLDFVRSLTRAQLELFIDVSCQGDGWHYRSGRLDIWQRRSDMLDAYELALILSGRMVTNTEYDGGRVVNPWSRGSEIAPMAGRYQRTGTVYQKYTGVVWCPTTENSTWMARRNGTVYFTGNSASQIESQAIKMHIVPQVEMICQGLTTGYLIPALSGMSLEEYGKEGDSQEAELKGERYVVWYDTSELEKKPDLGERAVQLHDRVVISDEALRQATGFDEASAPTDAEREQQILTRLAYNGQQATNAYEMLTGTPVSGGEAASATPQPGANLPASPPDAGPAVGERPTSRGPSNDAAPQTGSDLPPTMSETVLDIPVRDGPRGAYDVVPDPWTMEIRERINR